MSVATRHQRKRILLTMVNHVLSVPDTEAPARQPVRSVSIDGFALAPLLPDRLARFARSLPSGGQGVRSAASVLHNNDGLWAGPSGESTTCLRHENKILRPRMRRCAASCPS